METRKVFEIIWRQDLYPRFEPNSTVIQTYADELELLPPIEINQRNELIDGYHRWTAHKKAGVDTISVMVTETVSDRELLKLACRRNATYGLQLSRDEKKAKVLELYTGKDSEKAELAELFSVSKATITRWTERRDKNTKVARDRRIADLWLACWTEAEIADEVGLHSESQAVRLSGKEDIWQKNQIFATYQDPDWSPPLYDIWKHQEKTNRTNHFGNTEASLVDNLLYMYTQPFDVVVDPFAGGGSTIDVCKQRLRRYWVSDRQPIIERLDIRKHDILDGVPNLHKRWSNVALLYLDPPYWIQAKGKYSQDAQDLANMDLETFYTTLTTFVVECAKHMRVGSRVALIIQPTQWSMPDKQSIDHVIDLILRLQKAPLVYKRRIICPYESQQYNAQQVEWAKENRDVLILSREIIIWEIGD